MTNSNVASSTVTDVKPALISLRGMNELKEDGDPVINFRDRLTSLLIVKDIDRFKSD